MKARLLEAFLLLVISQFQLAIGARSRIVQINFIDGEDKADCLDGHIPCATLKYAFNNAVGNDTTFVLSPGDHLLNETVSFLWMEGVTIVGAGKGHQCLDD